MSATAVPTFDIATHVASRTAAVTREVTWPLYATLFASTCIVVGLIWDISWHRTVGRDTFWTYPHVLEQLAAIVSGLGCGWLILRTTFERDAAAEEERARAVKVWGFRGPLGAWVCVWGTVMMITSAPFDNWWHNAYGLDVKIVSPPHMVLAAGMIAICLGALLIALAVQNRDTHESGRQLGLPFAYGAGIIVCMQATIILETAGFANQMHVLVVLYGNGDHFRIAARGLCARLVVAVAGDDDCRRVHGNRTRNDVDAAAISRDAKARADL